MKFSIRLLKGVCVCVYSSCVMVYFRTGRSGRGLATSGEGADIRIAKMRGP